MGGAGGLAELRVLVVQEILADEGQFESVAKRDGEAGIGHEVGGDVLDAVDETQLGIELPGTAEIEGGT